VSFKLAVLLLKLQVFSNSEDSEVEFLAADPHGRKLRGISGCVRYMYDYK
jgi:hypothetical protein